MLDPSNFASSIGGLLGLLAGVNLFQLVTLGFDALVWLAEQLRTRNRHSRTSDVEPDVTIDVKSDIKPDISAMTKVDVNAARVVAVPGILSGDQ